MSYDNFTTFNVKVENAVAWVTFDYPLVNIQGLPMLTGLNMLAQKLETDRDIKVVVFQSANPEIFVAHTDGKSSNPLLPEVLPPKKKTRPLDWSYREMIDGIIYRLKNGYNWEDLPKDSPRTQRFTGTTNNGGRRGLLRP